MKISNKMISYKKPLNNKLRLYNVSLTLELFVLYPIIIPIIIIRKIIYLIKPNKRFLVIHMAKLGDLVCTTSLINCLAKYDKRNKVDVVVLSGTEEILFNNPNVGAIISYDPDVILNPLKLLIFNLKLFLRFNTISFGAHPSIESVILPTIACLPQRYGHTWGANSHIFELLKVLFSKLYSTELSDTIDECQNKMISAAGFAKQSWDRKVFYNKNDVQHVENILNEIKNDNKIKTIMIAPGVGNKLKLWDSYKYHDLIKLILENYEVNILIIGSDSDRLTNENIVKGFEDNVFDLTGKLTLNMLSYLCDKNVDLFIGSDTAVMFIADSSNVPVLVLAGHNDLKIQGPINKYRIIKMDIYCYPCNSVKSTKYICLEGHHQCLRDLSSEEVFRHFSEYINDIDKI